MTRDKSLSGVAGWLRFLVIIIFIGGVLHILVSIGGLEWKDLERESPELIYHSGFQNFQMADRVVDFLSGAVLLYAGFLLLKRKVIGTVISVKLIIGVIFPLLILVRYIVSPYLFLGMPPSEALAVDSGIPKDIARTFIWAAIWVSYLHRSDRVKNTYQ
ncbi:DUF2569 family protein [Pectobacterium wasabiae]|uniref:DUF2569 domain-containing protein n=1 Tax=Pectobacterium wasabiae TaxID=55208 RepID=A0AAW3EKY2_9GAMM|nr:DUF2569 family protein [Pectobacterium wasabiae]EJS93400.1 Hypothetical protein Y17_3426 [Pectobacterium wasabiae CFBP 3304]KFX08867.1 hypothetical protein JV38_03985 [Pectobacterium wasabiae]KGA28974.1 hypothetical protein KU73_07710 [Pectobacterium wasabiae]